MEQGNKKACLETVAIELFNSDGHLRTITAFEIGNPNDPSVDASEASLPNHGATAEPSGGRFELLEGEYAQVVGPARRGEELEGVVRCEVPRRLRPPRPRSHAQGS